MSCFFEDYQAHCLRSEFSKYIGREISTVREEHTDVLEIYGTKKMYFTRSYALDDDGKALMEDINKLAAIFDCSTRLWLPYAEIWGNNFVENRMNIYVDEDVNNFTCRIKGVSFH